LIYCVKKAAEPEIFAPLRNVRVPEPSDALAPSFNVTDLAI